MKYEFGTRICSVCNKRYNYKHLLSYNSFTPGYEKLRFTPRVFQSPRSIDYTLIEVCSCGYANFHLGRSIIDRKTDALVVEKYKGIRSNGKEEYFRGLLDFYIKLYPEHTEKINEVRNLIGKKMYKD